jgi:hypothetical protein
MKIKLEHVTPIYNLAQIIWVGRDDGAIRPLSRKDAKPFDAEKYGREVAERYNRRHDCEEEK